MDAVIKSLAEHEQRYREQVRTFETARTHGGTPAEIEEFTQAMRNAEYMLAATHSIILDLGLSTAVYSYLQKQERS